MKRTLLLSLFLTVLCAITTFGQEPTPLGNDPSKALPKSNSRSSSCYSTVWFENTGCKKLDCYWNNNGKDTYFATIYKNEKWGVDTYPGHKWVFKVNNTVVHRWSVRHCNHTNIPVDSKGCSGGGKYPPTNPSGNCCSTGDINSWLPDALARHPNCNPPIKCCTFRGRPAIDIDFTKCSGATDLQGLVFSCDGTVLDTYGGIGGIPKPIFNDCKDIDTGSGGSSKDGYCREYPSNCNYLTCTYQKKTYSDYTVKGTYRGNDKVSHWTLNGQKKSTSSKSTSWNVSSYGTYTVCTYYWCNGKKYKCCKKIKVGSGGY